MRTTTENLCSSNAEHSPIAVLFHIFLSLPVLLLPVHFNSTSLCEPSLTPLTKPSPLPLQHHPLCIECLHIHTVLIDPLQIFCLAASVSPFCSGRVWHCVHLVKPQGQICPVWTQGFESWDTDHTHSGSSEFTLCPLVVAVTVTTAASSGPNWPPLSMTLAVVPSLSSSANVQLDGGSLSYSLTSFKNSFCVCVLLKIAREVSVTEKTNQYPTPLEPSMSQGYGPCLSSSSFQCLVYDTFTINVKPEWTKFSLICMAP